MWGVRDKAFRAQFVSGRNAEEIQIVEATGSFRKALYMAKQRVAPASSNVNFGDA